MTGIFKANNPYNNFLLFVYALVLKAHLLWSAYPPLQGKNDGLLYNGITDSLLQLTSSFSAIFGVLTFILLFVQAISINNIVRSLKLTAKPHYLAGMSYLLVTSLFPAWFSFSAALLSSTLVIWCWSRLHTLHTTSAPLSTIFNLGFVLTIAAFIYLPSSLFLFVIFIALAISRAFRLREWVMVLVGIGAPFYFYFSYLYLTDALASFIWPRVTIGLIKLRPTPFYISSIAIVIIISLIGIYFVNKNFSKQVVTSRKNWQMVLIYLFFFCALFFFPSFEKINFPFLLAAPIAVLHSAAYFYVRKKWMSITMHLASFGIAIYLGYFSSFFGS